MKVCYVPNLSICVYHVHYIKTNLYIYVCIYLLSMLTDKFIHQMRSFIATKKLEDSVVQENLSEVRSNDTANY